MNAFIIILAIIGPLLALPPEAPPDPYAVMDQVNQLASGALWSGFEPQRIPVALFTGAKTLLFGHPRLPAGFLPVNGRQGVAAFPGRHESITANTSVELGGVPTATVMLDSLQEKSTAEIAAVVIHETFHVFQAGKHGDWSFNEMLLLTYPVDEVENETGLLLEARALAYALEAGTRADAARWAAGHLRLRRQRYEKHPAAADYERGVELYEGTAHYVEAKALGKPDDSESLTLLWRPDRVRNRCYFTGKAMAALLDRMSPDWKQNLESGQMKPPLDVLLQDSLASEEIAPAQLAQTEVSDLRAKAEQAVCQLKQEREKTVAEFRARPGTRIIIEFGDGRGLQLRFDPMNILKVGEREVLHRRWLALAGKNGSLQVLGLPALTLGLGPHPLFNGIQRVEIAGLAETPDIKESEGKLSIDTDTLKMDLVNAKFVRQGSLIRITLL